MKLMAISDTARYSCPTDQTTLSAAIAHKPAWIPDEGVVFVLMEDEGLLDWPTEVLVGWLERKELLLKCCGL